MEALASVIVIDCSVEAVTMSAIVFEVTPPCVALILLDPAEAPVPTPAPVMPNTAGFEDVQVAELVRF